MNVLIKGSNFVSLKNQLNYDAFSDPKKEHTKTSDDPSDQS